jgi:hypothetical protein
MRVPVYTVHRRKIRLIECNPKFCYLKKLPVKRDFAAGVYLSEAPSPPMTPYTPRYTLYACILHTYSHREGGGELTREKVRGAIVHKAGRKYQHD